MKDDIRLARLREKVSLLPTSPGVYQFLNADGKIIYVGKAKSLKRRVSSYFMRIDQQQGKLKVLVRQIEDIRHIVVNNEYEALLLENNMIKELQPRYNIMLKDDKTYPWIAISNEPFPRIYSTRRVVRDGTRYFGPYASVYIQKMLLESVRSIYRLRTCRLNLTEKSVADGKFGVCLKAHIGLCSAPCVGRISQKEYFESISSVEDILRGDLRKVVDTLREEMLAAASQLRFESAQKLKEKIEQLENFHSRSTVVNPSVGTCDVFYLLREDSSAYCNFMRIRGGNVISSMTVELKLGIEEQLSEILTFVISRISSELNGGLSREVIVQAELSNGELFDKVQFTVPKRGDKLRLLEFAEKNCRMYRAEQQRYLDKKSPELRAERLMEQMKKDLYLSEQPRHIECFDNSNIQGSYPVAACVVFRDGRPARSEYRHFNVKTVVGADDFATMREIIRRRYGRLLKEGAELPQLVVIDGGKGQLSAVYEVFEELGLTGRVALIGLAKRLEEIFFPQDSVPYYLDKNSETLKVLMHIRDEAHRFGITFHRNQRSKGFIHSELSDIKGIGEVTVSKLLKRYRTISKVRAASYDELCKVVGSRAAKILTEYFGK
jgi:excinuclease ABC subunit C